MPLAPKRQCSRNPYLLPPPRHATAKVAALAVHHRPPVGPAPPRERNRHHRPSAELRVAVYPRRPAPRSPQGRRLEAERLQPPPPHRRPIPRGLAHARPGLGRADAGPAAARHTKINLKLNGQPYIPGTICSPSEQAPWPWCRRVCASMSPQALYGLAVSASGTPNTKTASSMPSNAMGIARALALAGGRRVTGGTSAAPPVISGPLTVSGLRGRIARQ